MDSGIHTKITRISRFAQYLSLLFLVGTPLLYLYLLYTSEWSVLLKLPQNVVLNEAVLTLTDKIMLALVPLLSFVVYMLLFEKLFRLFALFKKGELFSHGTVAAILSIGYLLIAVDFVKIFESLLGSLLLNATGATQSSLYLNVGFSMLVVGFFVVIVGHVWKISLDMYENERLTV